ncbi:MAG TPA: aldo/keto reductase [Anaeromyxobacteraceae bacterium]|nr:aldo/keto reductase [Anaeromyxobacteraceae bacterium]
MSAARAAAPPPRPMELRPLGRGGPLVSRLGLGLAALGRPAYHTLGHDADFPEGRAPEQLERRTHAVLDAAVAAGVRYVDAARSYGRAEAFLRSWLERRGARRGEPVVGSKWGYRYVGEWRLDAERHEVKDHSLAGLRAQEAESLALLGPWLSLYQVHSATPESAVLADDAVLDELARLRDRGIRIGVTVSGPSQADVVRRALAITRGGAPLFDAIQATWNVLERSVGPALQEAHDAGRGVILKEPLANGRLGPRGDAAAEGPLAEAVRETGYAPDALALAAAVAQPWADVVLLGAVTVEQLHSNLGALALTPGGGELAALSGLREPPEAYWRRRATLVWR